MKLNDAVFGALFLALALLVLWTVQSYPKIPGQNVGPAAFPGVVAFGLAVCALLLIAQGVRARGDARWFALGAWTREPRLVLAFAITVGGLLLYVLAGDRLGFLLTGVLMLGSLMLVLRVRALTAVVVAVVATMAIHVAFYKGLRVPLPWGVLPVLY
ncbi:MAG: tripartite tricarboxylate transporter TctB family protein [Burkholderiaceae bacterium]